MRNFALEIICENDKKIHKNNKKENFHGKIFYCVV